MVEAYGDLMPRGERRRSGRDRGAARLPGGQQLLPELRPRVGARPAASLASGTLHAEELAARGFEITAMGWPVAPDAFGELLVRVHRDYRPSAIYVTENGAHSTTR